jgi:hypothetical protein
VPVPNSARLLSLESPQPGLFEAVVLRAYADASGAVYHFELVQRYRNRGPGLWERLPLDEAPLAPSTWWRGQRLLANLASADLPLLNEILPAVDAALVRACADWACPSDLRVPLVFAGRVGDLPPPGFAPREEPGAYPIAFDLAAVPRPDPRRLVVAAPSLAGRPHDDLARQALTRSLAASALAYVAGELTGSARRPADDFLDALIAREEIRLGLSAPAAPRLPPPAYVPPEDLWHAEALPPDATPADDLARRWQALAFLDFALAGQPPQVDGRLLVALRRRERFDDWLDTASVGSGGEVLAAWRQRLHAEFEGATTIPLSALDGLAYHCPDGAWLIRAGRRQPLVPGLGRGAPVLDPAGLSPDGRHLAVTAWSAEGWIRLELYDLETGARQVVVSSPNLSLVGWTAAGELLIYALLPPDEPSAGIGLWRLRPDAPEPRLVLASAVNPALSGLLPQGSAGRGLLGLTLVDPPVALRPALLSLADEVSLRPLSPGFGFGPALAPDASAVAFVSRPVSPAGLPTAAIGIEWQAQDPGAPAQSGLLAAGLARDGVPPTYAASLHWSPDGQALAFVASGDGYGTRLFLFDRAAQALTQVAGGRGHYLLPLRFSADGRYLAYLQNVGSEPFLWWIVRDLSTGLETRHAFDFGHLRRIQTGLLQPISSGVGAWSPAGHLLAVSSPAGLFVTDPATNDRRWLTLEPCGRVVWW